MYIYFDINGNLKEMINYPVREQSYGENIIYAYVEKEVNNRPDGDTYELPLRWNNAKIIFEGLDSHDNLNTILNTPDAMTKVSGVQIPSNNKRDLYFFKYGYKYDMWSITLPTPVTSTGGQVVASIILFDNTQTIGTSPNLVNPQFALNRFAFNVEESAGIVIEPTMTESQYSFLYNNMDASKVPYTGAIYDVNLGNHTLIIGTEWDSGEEGKYTTYDNDSILIIRNVYVNSQWSTYGTQLLFPDDDGTYTLATQEWVDSLYCSKEDIQNGTIVAGSAGYATNATNATYATNTDFTEVEYNDYPVGSHGSVSLPTGTATYHMYWTSSLIVLDDPESVNFGIVYVGTGTMNAFGKDVLGNEYILYLSANEGTLYKKAADEDEFDEFASGYIFAKKIR